MANIDQIVSFLLSALDEDESTPDLRIEIEALITPFVDKLHKPIPPKLGETVAVAGKKPRTAALLFDRVCSYPLFPAVPAGILAYGATEPEVWCQLAALGEMEQLWDSETAVATLTKVGVPRWRGGPTPERVLVEAIRSRHDWDVTPVFDSAAARDQEYSPGNYAVIAAALQELDVVHEDRLTWEQVGEFRADLDCRAAYRRLMHWLDNTMVGKSPIFIRDEIAQRLEDYRWSLRKHGIETVLGSISSLIDPAFLSASTIVVAATELVGNATWAALSGAALGLGRLALSVCSQTIGYVDKKRSSSREIAFVHELERL